MTCSELTFGTQCLGTINRQELRSFSTSGAALATVSKGDLGRRRSASARKKFLSFTLVPFCSHDSMIANTRDVTCAGIVKAGPADGVCEADPLVTIFVAVLEKVLDRGNPQPAAQLVGR